LIRGDPCYIARMSKRLKLAQSEIKSLAVGYGGCIASDKITVGGERVCFMTRDEPVDKVDSGWVFLAGTETQAYRDDKSHFAVYDVNTIANYDREIVPLLHALPGARFERVKNEGPLVPCEGVQPAFGKPRWPPPGFPLVEGLYAMTKSWSLALPERFALRIEDGSLVLWRSGVTLWINAFDNPDDIPQATRLASMKKVMSSAAMDVREERTGPLTRLTYRLRDDKTDSLTTCVFSDAGQIQMAIYFDHEGDAAEAVQIAASVTAT
jgi:hypothetical protein